MASVTVNSGNLYHETTKHSRDFRVYPWSLQLDKHAEAETHHEPHGITGSDTFSRTGDTRRWYLKVNVVKEEEYPRKVSRRSSAVQVSKVARRSAGGLGITEEAIPVITIGLRYAFPVAHLAWPLSRCAVQNGIFYVCESRRPSDENASRRLQPRRVSRALFSSFFPPLKRESRTRSLPSLPSRCCS